MGNYLIYLHPKMNVSNNVIIGAEATIRSRDVNGKTIVPEFIMPICNQEGAAFHIDFFVLDKICKLISELEAKGKNAGNFTIYFSQITLLERNAVKHMQEICSKHNVSPSAITIGLSEDISTMSSEGIVEVAKQIKAAGFCIAIELLGAKYSSLATLSKMSFDEVKIGKGVVKEILLYENSMKITKYIINILQGSRKCLIISEGIESQEEVSLMKESGLEFAQGCYFLPPVSIDDFQEKYA